MDLDDVYKPGSSLDMPKRPPWDYSMSRGALDAREETYFKVWVYACAPNTELNLSKGPCQGDVVHDTFN